MEKTAEVYIKTSNCSKCGASFQHKSNSIRSYCPDCYSAWTKDRYDRGIKRQSEEYKRRNHYERKYGITLEEYDFLFAEQSGVCAICKHPEKKIDARSHLVQRLHVDHDHKTGKIRGLLCNACNIILGLADDNPDYFRSLVVYLEQHN